MKVIISFTFENKEYIFDVISKYSIFIIIIILTMAIGIIFHLAREFHSNNLQPKDRWNQWISRVTATLCIFALGSMIFSYFSQSNDELKIKAIGVMIFIGAVFFFLIFKLLGDYLISIRVNRSY